MGQRNKLLGGRKQPVSHTKGPGMEVWRPGWLIHFVTHTRCWTVLSISLPICQTNEVRYLIISMLLVHVAVKTYNHVQGDKTLLLKPRGNLEWMVQTLWRPYGLLRQWQETQHGEPPQWQWQWPWFEVTSLLWTEPGDLWGNGCYNLWFLFFSCRDLELLEKREKRESLVCQDLGYEPGTLLARVCQVIRSVGSIFWPVHIFMLYNLIATEASLIFLPQPSGPWDLLLFTLPPFPWLSGSLEYGMAPQPTSFPCCHRELSSGLIMGWASSCLHYLLSWGNVG